ncbi:exodeoxyribonuclease VII large subunit [Psychrobacter sp. M13]|uniref:OB-fold nucleic acid binding domain-containing protein n=1 Tax=Psychrobacter sp. M13 TaxID=3067275 RepID=UPI00273CCB04|nr:exodeoxyribonuclease VII large subunit [Psychrobacter sp. M13]WLP94396.1 exodeoxyribonuclease VII large subunit [Psychrobacter sp. M13]
MTNNSNYKLAFLTVALLLLGSVAYVIYTKYSVSSTNDMASENISTLVNDNNEEEAYVNDNYNSKGTDNVEQSAYITGKVVNVNTNAEQKTFIKVNSFADHLDYTLLTSLEPQLVNVNLGDVISFPDTLNKSHNNAYYFVNKTSDYKVVGKNTETYIGTETINVSDVQGSMQGRDVLLNAMISDLKTSKKGHSFFKVSDDKSSINGVLFNSETNQLEDRLLLLEDYNDTSKRVKLEGKIGIYKNELQIIVSKVYN